MRQNRLDLAATEEEEIHAQAYSCPNRYLKRVDMDDLRDHQSRRSIVDEGYG